MLKPTVFIVGASRGIGHGFVCKYLAEGWSVHATARKESDLARFPDGVTGHLLDVTSQDQIASVVTEMRGQTIDLLIHNAGVGRGTPKDTMISVNVQAPFEVIEAFLPLVAASQQRKIAIMSSQLGSRKRFGDGVGGLPSDIYGGSKCMLNDRFRVEEPRWREEGVSSLVVHPGWVQTDMGGQSADISVQESVDGMAAVFNALCLKESGKFVTYEGVEHPW